MELIEKGIYAIRIDLPDNPLKWLNCYVLKGGHKNLLIDSGFNCPVCTEELLAGMAELELNAGNTDVLFTHMHSDHTGNGSTLAGRGFRILMGQADYELLGQFAGNSMPFRSRLMGVGPELLERIVTNNPGLRYMSAPFPAEFIRDGEKLNYGGRTLECIEVPGHTPGNFCLYDRENEVMFTGDHVLFDISPNIISWTGRDDCLGDYIHSLLKVRDLPVRLALPAHRTSGEITMAQRIDALIEHHGVRLDETYRFLKSMPDSTACELAGHVRWRIRAKSWEDFPDGQKWFAIGETFAHLLHLEKQGVAVSYADSDGALRFRAAVKNADGKGAEQ